MNGTRLCSVSGSYSTYFILSYAPSNAEANVIESVSVNGTALTPTNKGVNITVPTTVASLADASNYALKTDFTNVYKYKGSVDKVRDAKTEADISTLRSDIERLERKQDAHNKLIERMYDVKSDIKVINEKINEIGR